MGSKIFGILVLLSVGLMLIGSATAGSVMEFEARGKALDLPKIHRENPVPAHLVLYVYGSGPGWPIPPGWIIIGDLTVEDATYSIRGWVTGSDNRFVIVGSGTGKLGIYYLYLNGKVSESNEVVVQGQFGKPSGMNEYELELSGEIIGYTSVQGIPIWR
ncbi:hypothetical protein A3K80_02030 [Candidatus Bathyarchaeota archaeon RBG_13_38_9]|nr:MAG: hypothetical protein A3K80_02030 [Candidatus Bathyarchaeota archaeon RBG_13_38_9]